MPTDVTSTVPLNRFRTLGLVAASRKHSRRIGPGTRTYQRSHRPHDVSPSSLPCSARISRWMSATDLRLAARMTVWSTTGWPAWTRSTGSDTSTSSNRTNRLRQSRYAWTCLSASTALAQQYTMKPVNEIPSPVCALISRMRSRAAVMSTSIRPWILCFRAPRLIPSMTSCRKGARGSMEQEVSVMVRPPGALRTTGTRTERSRASPA